MQGLVGNSEELKKRVENFLVSDARGIEASSLIDDLAKIGEVGIFGGMLRDIARHGAEGFASDIDLVVDGPSEQLATVFSTRSAQRNRFGGYRFCGIHSQFDVWSLQDTWAVKQGLVSASSLADLTRTTFFDWDAAVYAPHSDTLFCSEDYISRLHSGVVTINLEANPNTLGAIARTLRILLDWNVGLSDHLADFLWKELSAYDQDQLIDAQKITIGSVPLKRKSIKKLRRKLSERDFFNSSFKQQSKKLRKAF